ncbi:MAG: C-3',4' desaturase CrtD [Synechococcus sp.]|nr:C-3',4' desaturase CrtD [Synechococcus sp.]
MCNKPDGVTLASTDVVVIGAGIAGLTAAALLSRQGCRVVLLEAHQQSGGCAGTFQRGRYIFDAGATQVAGFEPGGSHQRLFAELGVPLPPATPLDPGCVVDLGDGQPAVQIWRNPQRWRQERQRQFPSSERFWQLCERLHQSNWAFAAGRPVLPPRNLWDLRQLLGALNPATLASGLLAFASMADLLRLSGCVGPQHQRLRRFLDLQLKLYSQEPAHRTAALYGVTVLAMVQEPLGLWHLHGSMQALSNSLETALQQNGGELRLQHRVEQLISGAGGWQVQGTGPQGQPFTLQAAEVVCTLPPQALPTLLGSQMPSGLQQRVQRLGDPSGALVLYGAVPRACLPESCPSHLQLQWAAPGPLFVSVSQEGDGRAPAGEATVIASVFTPARPWFDLDRGAYRQAKRQAQQGIEAGLQQLLGIGPQHWLQRELATPRGFARWTGRPFGFVGGIGQAPDRFGPFGLASRSPLAGLWLCGDAIYPGEGTAGVSLSAEMAVRQLLQAQRNPGRAA